MYSSARYLLEEWTTSPTCDSERLRSSRVHLPAISCRWHSNIARRKLETRYRSRILYIGTFYRNRFPCFVDSAIICALYRDIIYTYIQKRLVAKLPERGSTSPLWRVGNRQWTFVSLGYRHGSRQSFGYSPISEMINILGGVSLQPVADRRMISIQPSDVCFGLFHGLFDRSGRAT